MSYVSRRLPWLSKYPYAPWTAKGKHFERVDCEYERADTAAVFLGRPHGPYVLSH